MSAKHKGVGPQALTANELREGLVVWLSPEMEWVTDYQKALKTEDADVITKMQAIGERDDLANLIVGVYFIDIDVETDMPVRYREKFRVNGPSYDPGELLKANSKNANSATTSIVK